MSAPFASSRAVHCAWMLSRRAGYLLVGVCACVGMLLGCPRKKSHATDGGLDATAATASVSPKPSATTSLVEAGAGAAVDEPPLAWGTRPPASADLYVAIDGPCVAMDVYIVPDGTIALFDNGKFGRVTADGFDLDVGKGFEQLKLEEEHEGIDEVGGRIDDLWTANTGGGSVFH